MSNPLDPELGTDAPAGPVPVDNQPGHHPATEQDKPDMRAFAERLGTVADADRDGGDDNHRRPSESAGRRSVPSWVPTSAAAVVAVVLVVVVLGRLAVRRRRSTRPG